MKSSMLPRLSRCSTPKAAMKGFLKIAKVFEEKWETNKVTTTIAGMKLEFWPGTHKGERCTTLKLEEVAKALFGALELNEVRWGDMSFRQTGLPTGGMLSRVALSCCLVSCEEQASEHAGRPLSDWLFEARYVDDLLTINTALCRTCVRK